MNRKFFKLKTVSESKGNRVLFGSDDKFCRFRVEWVNPMSAYWGISKSYWRSYLFIGRLCVSWLR